MESWKSSLSPDASSNPACLWAPASTAVSPKWRAAIEASGAEVVTVAVRRVNLTDKSKESLLDYIDRSKYLYSAQYRRLLHRR